jgi:cbb3-type cytochrome oxidase subunit 3
MTFLSTVFADGGSVVIESPGVGNIDQFTLSGILSWAVSAIIIVAGLIFFFMLIIGGLRWILSGGDKAATEAARGQITAALIGLVIVFSAWAIAQLIQAVFGVEILNLTIPGIS